MRRITGVLGGRDADFRDYARLLHDRPKKFSATEAGFMGPAGRGMPTCGECVHWFMNPETGRTVCEIVRLPGEQNIRASSACRFQTRNGRSYPLIEEI